MNVIARSSFFLAIVLVSAAIGLTFAGIRMSSEAAAVNAVTVGDNFFAPQAITIPAGTAVEWKNSGELPHTSTSSSGVSPKWDSGFLTSGQTYSQVFDAAGTFAYRCLVHPDMTGTLVVEAAAATPPPQDLAPPQSATLPVNDQPAQPEQAPAVADAAPAGSLPVGGGPPRPSAEMLQWAILLGALGAAFAVLGAIAMTIGLRGEAARKR